MTFTHHGDYSGAVQYTLNEFSPHTKGLSITYYNTGGDNEKD